MPSKEKSKEFSLCYNERKLFLVGLLKNYPKMVKKLLNNKGNKNETNLTFNHLKNEVKISILLNKELSNIEIDFGRR